MCFGFGLILGFDLVFGLFGFEIWVLVFGGFGFGGFGVLVWWF